MEVRGGRGWRSHFFGLTTMVSHTPPALGPFQVKRLVCVCTPNYPHSVLEADARQMRRAPPTSTQPQIATCQLILSAGPRAVFTCNITVLLSDRCVCLHTGCPLLYELGVHKANAWGCRAYGIWIWIWRETSLL